MTILDISLFVNFALVVLVISTVLIQAGYGEKE
jgi:hypothetical protein